MALAGSITASERYQLAREAGFNAPDAIVMTAISLAECANCDLSGVNATGDTGLWQINKVHWGSSNPASTTYGNLADPLTNAKAAYAVWKGAGSGVAGFKQWCTYPGGCGGGPGVPNFPALLTSATVAAGQVDPSAPPQIDLTGGAGGQSSVGGGAADTGGGTLGSTAGAAGSDSGSGSVVAGSDLPVIGGITGAANQAAALMARLRSPGFWWAVLLFGLALAGVVAGVILYAKSGLRTNLASA